MIPSDHKRILLLDDEKSILDVLSEHLTAEGYDCESTTSATEALDWLSQGGFEVLVTDLNMPEMNGLEVVKRASTLCEDLMVIVVTALVEASNAVDAMRAGAEDYILKPFNLSEITISIDRVLEKRRLVIENREYQRDLEARVSEATRDLQRANEELRRSSEYLESLLHSTIDSIFTVDRDFEVGFVNEGLLNLLDAKETEILGHSVENFLAEGGSVAHELRRMLAQKRVVQNFETNLKRKDGVHIPVNISLSIVHNSDGEAVSALAICKDITEQKRLEHELKELAIRDNLTGLYNHRYFFDRLEQEIERANRQKHPLSLLLFDVDQFKTYNDTRGHLAGDEVLRTAGKIVMECTREHVDIGFRYGGDEFTIILPEAGHDPAYRIADRIRATFAGHRFDDLTVSLGLMTYQAGTSMNDFIKAADGMMYDAKRSGGNRVYVYDPADMEKAPTTAETKEEK